MSDKNNALRCAAAEIVAQLYALKDDRQLNLLKGQVDASLRTLGQDGEWKIAESLNNFVQLAATYACSVVQNSIFGRPKFAVLDCDGELFAEGNTPEEAAAEAIRAIENRD
jgi:hypothetical protein